MLLLFILSNKQDSIGCNESIRLIASSLGQSSPVCQPQTWIEGFMHVLKEVKCEQLRVGIQRCLQNLSQGHMMAMREMMVLSQIRGLSANPFQIAMELPYVLVLGKLTKDLQQAETSLGEGTIGSLMEIYDQNQELTIPDEVKTIKDILSVCNDLVFPDPSRINSERSSSVIVRRTGSTLHTVFRMYESCLTAHFRYHG
jgi:hypothetical protein